MKFGRSVLLFVKSPEKGKVKSRLSAAIGEEIALDIYKSFVLDILETVERAGYPLSIWFYPPEAKEIMSTWLGKGFVYMPQEGDDLGERMRNAFHRSFSEGLDKVILIGSDIPDIRDSVIDEAFGSLENSGAVIGPASDGGYYLIGFSKSTFMPDVFRGIPWSTESVFQETVRILERPGFRIHVLPEKSDVDTLDDLRSFFMRNRDSELGPSRTMSAIAANKTKIFG
jgi:rSAM/selenodomain-associated transferase 1